MLALVTLSITSLASADWRAATLEFAAPGVRESGVTRREAIPRGGGGSNASTSGRLPGSSQAAAITVGAAVPASPALQAAVVGDRPGRCSRAISAVKWYSGRVQFWARKMGVGPGTRGRANATHESACPRYLAKRLRAKAAAYRARWERFLTTPHLRGETPWHTSMRNPVNRALWRLAVCETGGINGGRPLWTHHNAVYSGALGFAHSTWARWRYYVRPLPPSVAARATPAQQLAVGRALVRTFGGYSSWPSCSVRLGLR